MREDGLFGKEEEGIRPAPNTKFGHTREAEGDTKHKRKNER